MDVLYFSVYKQKPEHERTGLTKNPYAVELCGIPVAFMYMPPVQLVIVVHLPIATAPNPGRIEGCVQLLA